MPRPRLHPAGTHTATVARAKILAAGGRQISVVLSPDAARDLARLTADGTTVTRAVERALAGAASNTHDDAR